jgi:hypothetical protein
MLDHDQTVSGWGLALLVHRGVTAWMRACSVMVPETSPARCTAELPSCSADELARRPVSFLPEVSGKLAHVLTQMILETRQEVLT